MSETNQARRSLARGGIAGFVGAAASAVLGFAFTIILSRMLGAQGAGVVTQATGVFAIVMALAKVGLDSTAIYLLPRLSLDAPQEIRATLSFMATMTVAVSTVCVLVLEVAAPFIWDAQVASSTRAVLWFVPIGALTLVASAALRALGNMREYVLVQNLLLPGLRPLLVALMRILGDGFAPGASVLVVLCIGSIVTFMAGNIHSLLIMSGRSGWAAVNKIVVLALNIVGNIIFIPRGGMVAAAIVWAVCMVLDAAMATVQVSRFVGVTPKLSEVVKPILVVGVSVVIPGGCIAAVLGRDSFVATVTGSLLSILTFACACWIFRERLHLTGLGSLVRARKR